VSKIVTRLLLIDNSADDAEAVSNHLRQAGYLLKTQRVDDKSTLDAALRAGTWDAALIKADHPRLKIADTLACSKLHGVSFPLLVVAPNTDAASVHQWMTAGARDVMQRGDWSRLGPALEREIAVHREQCTHKETVVALQQLEERYRVLVENSQEATGYCHDGAYVDANPAYLRLFGYRDLDELKATPVLSLIDKQDHARFKSWLRKPDSHHGMQEYMAASIDGRRCPVEIALSPIRIGGELCVQISVRDISKRRALEDKLQYLHQRDPLTGVFSRHYLLQALGKIPELCGADGSSCMLLGVEIHGLKDLNRAIGHSACDRLLIAVTRQLREHIGPRSLLARAGGGQFALLLPVAPTDDPARVTETLGQTLRALRFKEGGVEIPLDISVRHTALRGQPDDREGLLASVFTVVDAAPRSQAAAPSAAAPTPATLPPSPADSATPVAVRPDNANGNAKPSVDAAIVSRAVTESALEMRFQPIVNLHGEPREFYEVFPVIPLENGEILAASTFMATAVRLGLAGQIDRWLMQQTIDQLVRHKKEKRDIAFFLHLSPMALTDNVLLSAARRHLTATGVDAERLYLQIPCALVRTQSDAARRFAEEAKSMNMNIVIDGVDARLADAAELAGLQAGYFAIDCQTQLGRRDGNIDDTHLRRAVALANDLQGATIARRVEDADAFGVLWTVGVGYIQGDYLSPALTGPDHNFAEEQTLSSDERPPAFTWQAAS
jgi:diguanylate cyclase (GGDEF)-like protein/PAS domain S-box-containing protein